MERIATTKVSSIKKGAQIEPKTMQKIMNYTLNLYFYETSAYNLCVCSHF